MSLNAPAWLEQLKNIMLRYLKLGAVVCTLFSLTGYLGKYHLFFDLTSHFKLQYLGFTFCTLIVFLLIRRQPLWLGLCAFCIALNFAAIAPWYWPQSSLTPDASDKPLRVLLSNVLTSNQQYDKVISLIREEQPDIFVVLELNETWATALEPIQDIFPNALIHPREDNFGLAIYSKLPLQKASAQYFLDDVEVPSLLAEIVVNGQAVTILATHPLPPIGTEYFKARNRQLAVMSDYLQNLPQPKLVIGDLNATFWSPFYRNFVETAGLTNTRSGFGIQPTWPTKLPLLYIPLDHCLMSAEFQAIASRTGKNIGSDHLPLVADLVLLKDAGRGQI